MFQYLTEPLTQFFIRELREFWSTHPKYPGLVENIQGKYSWETEPNEGIIVKSSGSSHVRYSADNYKGIRYSYATLFKPKGTRGVSIEWLKEDALAIKNNNGYFPSPPGFYFVKILSVDNLNGILTFNVTRYYDITDEILALDSLSNGTLLHVPLQNTVSIRVMPSDYQLFENINYIVNYTTGEITFIQPLPPTPSYVTVSYRYSGGVSDPYKVQEESYHKNAIPGVLMAFGRRSFVNDIMVIAVTKLREPAYKVYGGRWSGTIDLDCFSKDEYGQREITTWTMNFVEAMLRPAATAFGIEITEVSGGDATEEPYDDNADDYKYSATVSVTVDTEWEMHNPIVGRVSSIEPLTLFEQQQYAGLTDEQIALVSNNIRYTQSIGLVSIQDPFFNGRRTFESIK
jgi:hypothetical protein